MRFLILTLTLTIATSWSAFGKAYFYTQSELIQKAAVIAIIDIAEPSDTPKSFQEYRQQANIQVVKILKGEVPQKFTLYGKGSFICAQCILSKGRFIAFLRKDGDLWVGTNWQLSLRPIRDGEVEWYVSNEQRFPMKFQKLDEVVAVIQTELNRPQSEQAGADQPTTAPELKSEGKDKPQPESKVAPR